MSDRKLINPVRNGPRYDRVYRKCVAFLGNDGWQHFYYDHSDHCYEEWILRIGENVRLEIYRGNKNFYLRVNPAFFYFSESLGDDSEKAKTKAMEICRKELLGLLEAAHVERDERR